MADAPSKQDKFWSSTGISTRHDSFVPGVNDVGNRRPKVKGGKTREVKATVPVQQPVVVETTDNHGKTTSSGLLSSDISTLGTDISTLHSSGVTLKDLCADDKKRIANLIKELAKVGEEKENAEQNLSAERQHYQQQILALVQQQEAILKEREDVQNRLVEYQSYIVKQQQLQQMLQQQEQQRQHLTPPHQYRHRVKNPVSVAGKKNYQGFTGKQSRQHQPLSDDVEEDEEEEEGEEEQPSAHLYINQSIDQSACIGELSTQAIPSQSPPPQPLTDRSRPRPQRPFTAMIDRQLSEERRNVDTLTLEGAEFNEDMNNTKTLKHATNSTALEIHKSQRTEKYRKTDRENNNDTRVLKNLERITSEHGNHHPGKEGFSDFHPILPGADVSPEKAEIFSRFMDSQLKSRTSGEECEMYHAGGEVRRGRNSEDKLKGKKRRKERQSSRPPPPSFGGFYPPIMSSTQKSSEIGDYISHADSTMISDTKDKNDLNVDANYIDEERGHKRTGRTEGQGKFITGNEENNDRNYNQSNNVDKLTFMDRTEGEDVKARVDFMDSVVDNDNKLDGVDMGVDKDFLCYYKKLSAAERKQELLKQRATLLQEQNKLRKLLTQQQQQQQLKQRQRTVEKPRDEGSGRKDEKESRMERRRKERRPDDGIRDVADDMEGGESNPDLHSDVIVSGHGLKKGRTLINKGGEMNSPFREVDEFGRKTQTTRENEDGVTLRGKDGEECVTYSNQSTHSQKEAEDNVVKKLDYSLLSDTEDDIRLSPSNLDKKFVVSPLDNHDIMPDTNPSIGVPGQKGSTKMTSSPLPVLVDAGTSISFATLPGHEQQRPDDAKTVRDSQRKTERRSVKPFSESPGDKTLAVLEIINSLPDEHTYQSPAARKMFSSHDSGSRSKRPNVVDSRHLKYNMAQSDKGVAAKKSLFSQWNSVRQSETHPLDNDRINTGQVVSKHLHGDPVGMRHVSGKQQGFSVLGSKDIGRRKFMATSDGDSELDIFVFNGWKDERMDGYRKIISGRNDDDNSDDDDDETFYDYDDKGDSDIDIVEGLLFSDVDDIVDNDRHVVCGDDNKDDEEDENEEVWDSVIRSLNSIPKIKSDSKFDRLRNVGEVGQRSSDLNDFLSSDVNIDDDDDNDVMHAHRKHRAVGNLNQRPKVRQGDLEESSILKDIFFVSH